MAPRADEWEQAGIMDRSVYTEAGALGFTGMDGFDRGRNLEKVGQHSQDTAELFFADVRVPAHKDRTAFGSPIAKDVLAQKRA